MLEAMSETPNQVQVVSSNLNLAPVHAITWGAEQHRDTLAEAGYDGMMYYPLYSKLAWEIRKDEPIGDIVTGFLQNWREDTRVQTFDRALLHTTLAVPRGLKAIKDAFVEGVGPLSMPHLTKSLGVIANIQTRISRQGNSEYQLPVIVHPFGQMLGDGDRLTRRNYTEWVAGGRVGPLLCQPTAELAVGRGVRSKDPVRTADNLIESLDWDGIHDMALDTGHLFSERPYNGEHVQFSPDEALAISKRLATIRRVARVELSVQPRFHTLDNLRDIMDGNLTETPQGQAIQTVYETVSHDGFIPEMGVEIPAYAFEAIGMNYQTGHNRLQPMLRGFVNGILAAKRP